MGFPWNCAGMIDLLELNGRWTVAAI